MDRRSFSMSLAAAMAVGCSPSLPRRTLAAPDPTGRFSAIRATLGEGARIGVLAIDTGSGATVGHHEHGRFAMASTFKLPLAAIVLAESDAGRLSLSEELPFASGDPLSNSPIVRANFARGRLPVDQLAAAIVMHSDNSAANLLLLRIGGPDAFTRRLRAWGDEVTRLDRYELALNSNTPGDPRDTTSPLAMASLVARLFTRNLLSQASRHRLALWLETSVPGADRLRAGLPFDWRFGHKTGTGLLGAYNDVGLAWPPRRAPIVIASFQDAGNADAPTRAAAHASVARLVAEILA